MRTNIVIDDKLMNAAIKASGAQTKRAAVEMGLQALIRISKQKNIRNLRGTFDLKADLEAMRYDT
jgi:Arc/MetJ family transcription regulator